MKVQYRITLGVLFVIVAVLLFRLLIGASIVATLTPAGPVAWQEMNLIKNMVLIMLLVVVPVFVALFVLAWKYRADNPRLNYQPEQSHGIWGELILWIIPAVIVATLAVLVWNSAHVLDPYNPIKSKTQALTIQVVALQWKWLFIYPKQNIATVNFVEFPENTPVHFELTADAGVDSPMSSFWIPQLGSQIYAMAAMQTELNLMADRQGSFIGKDTEINGAGYAGMTFVAKSTTETNFNNWVWQVQHMPAALTDDVYSGLVKPSQNNPPAYYSFVQANLFDTIIMKFMMPAAGSPTKASSAPNMPGMNMDTSTTSSW